MNIEILPRWREGTFEGIWDVDSWRLTGYLVLMAQHFKVGLVSIGTEYDYERVVQACDGLIVPGSPINIDPTYYGGEPFDPPEKYDEYALDRRVIAAFADAGKPMLGICGGIQALNVFFGGTLKRVKDLRGDRFSEPHKTVIEAVDRYGNPVKYSTHPIEVEEDSFVYDVFGKRNVTVNTYHGWAVDRPAPGFRVVARSLDGIVEAIEWKERRIFGTQWHPELCFRMGDEVERKLFENFLNLCADGNR